MKQRQSSTSADILVDIFNPYKSIRISADVDDCPCFTALIATIPIQVKLVSSPNIIIGTKKINKQVYGKICNFTINTPQNSMVTVRTPRIN